MHFSSGVFACLTAAALLASTQAATDPPSIHEAELIAAAFQHYPALAAARAKLAAYAEGPASISLPDPTLSYAEYVERMDSRRSIGITQQFPFPGTLQSRQRIASLETDKKFAELLASQAQLRLRIRTLVAEWQLLQHSRTLLREQSVLLEQLSSMQHVQLGAADSTADTAALAQVEVELVKDQLQQTRIDLQVLAQQLSQLTGLESLSPETLIDAAPLPTVSQVEKLQQKVGLHPSLNAARTNRQIAQQRQQLTRLEDLPSFHFGVEWTQGTMSRNETMLQIGVSLPIWQQRNRARRNQARELHRAAEYQVIQRQTDLRTSLNQELLQLENARRQYHLYHSVILPQMDAALQAASASFAGNQAGSPRLLQLRVRQLELQMMLLRAQAQARVSLARIESLTDFPTDSETSLQLDLQSDH